MSLKQHQCLKNIDIILINHFICWKSFFNFQLDQQVEAEELSNSVLLEISRSSVVKWQGKLQTKYGWFKTDNCKNIIFEVRSLSNTAGHCREVTDKSFLNPSHVSLCLAYDAHIVKISQHSLRLSSGPTSVLYSTENWLKYSQPNFYCISLDCRHSKGRIL